MKAIMQYFSDPAWWFTVVAVGLIVSILAAYLKDGLTYLVSQLSRSYADKRTKALNLRKAKIDFYSDSQELLCLAYLRSVLAALFAFAAMGMTILLPVFHVSVKSKPELDSILNGPIALSTTTIGVLNWVLLVVAMRAYWNLARLVSFAREVHARFREKSYPEALK